MALLAHLGIERAHFGARDARDWRGMVERHPDVVGSLTLVLPDEISSEVLAPIASRVMAVLGDQGEISMSTQGAMFEILEAPVLTLRGYEAQPTSDAIADRTLAVQTSMCGFLERNASLPPLAFAGDARGEVAGVRYEIAGSGPPLVLLPQGLAPSQWGLLLPELSERYATIVVGGAGFGVG